MTVTPYVERTAKRTNGELLESFADCKRRYGDDLGLMFISLILDCEDRIAALEERLAKLEQKRR